jgi:hypothetical protein
MAMKIPDAPNVIGTQPVLREVDSVNPAFERPNFKIDVSAPVDALKNVGKAYADYVDYNTNIWMGAACNQFTHDLLSEEQRLKDTHTELAANDLYAKLEKYATGVLDDMTGAPKDDGRVRIANPELQKRFRDWASKQMPAYQSRMMNYTASELDKANTKILKQGIEDTNKFIIGSSYETAGEEFEAAWPSYIRAAQLSAPGMPKEYQMAEAARMMDEAVYAKMKMLSDNSIPEAVQWYYNVPAVQKSLSSKSQAAFFKDMQDHYVEQGGAWLANELATGGSGTQSGGYLDQTILRAVFPGKSNEEVGAIYAKVYDKGREINDARIKAQQGMREQQLSAVQGKSLTIDLNNPEQVIQTYQEYHNIDPEAADSWVRSVQKHLADAMLEEEFNRNFPLGDPLEGDRIEDMMVGVLGQDTTEDLLQRSVRGGMPDITMHQADILNRHAKMIQDNSAWVNSPVYAEYVAKAGAGEYHGEDVPELRGLPLELRNNLGQIAYYNDRYNEVVRVNPHLDDDIKSRVKDYNKKGSTYIGNLKREIVKSFDRYKQSGSSYPMRDSIEYNNILNSAINSAESPTKARTEQYLNREAVDYLNTQKINPYLNPEAAREALEDVDALPLNLKVAKKIKKGTDAEDLVDAIISATPRMKRHLVEQYREAMIKHVEDTGNADVWYQFIDGIGK